MDVQGSITSNKTNSYPNAQPKYMHARYIAEETVLIILIFKYSKAKNRIHVKDY